LKTILTVTLTLGLILAPTLGVSGPALHHEPQADQPWAVYFSPDGGATAAIVEVLGRAHETVLVQAYVFTSVPIAKALVEAHKRGVRVEVILDKGQRGLIHDAAVGPGSQYSAADFLAHAGIPVLIDSEHAIAHNKVMVIDGSMVITGSFNFTKAAESQNAENLLVIHDPALATRYIENWQIHAGHSMRYTSRQALPF
jgi:phosphatidylserine/phosphatidylglycerophosphate/cardiolipin synthase-like enzyme